jgi:hypothetical protein
VVERKVTVQSVYVSCVGIRLADFTTELPLVRLVKLSLSAPFRVSKVIVVLEYFLHYLKYDSSL